MKLSDDFSARPKLEDVGRWHITRFVESVALTLPAGSWLLDAGAGECAYKRLFGAHRYVSVDAAVGDSSWNYLNYALVFLDRCDSTKNAPFGWSVIAYK